jgi:hypothetical protein
MNSGKVVSKLAPIHFPLFDSATITLLLPAIASYQSIHKQGMNQGQNIVMECGAPLSRHVEPSLARYPR